MDWIKDFVSWIKGWWNDMVQGFTDWAIGLLPDWLGTGFADLFGYFGPMAQYLAWLFALDWVIPTVLASTVIRFSIRRLPIVG